MFHIASFKRINMQSANTILMVKPSGFRFNEETAVNNHFQMADESQTVAQIQNKAVNEFDSMVSLLQKNGVFAIVLECVSTSVAKQITQKLSIPTIGIGSSVHCDGQVLVTDDLLGINDTKIRFVKKFMNLKKYINLGLKKFAQEVRSKRYPSKKHSY